MASGPDAEQILAFRLGRSGLAARAAVSLADAAACPVSDFSRDAALLALAARTDDVSRASYEQGVDSGEVVVAHVVRGAIHAVAPGDAPLYGRALLADDEGELAAQLGHQVQELAAERGFSTVAALGEVADATRAALADGATLDKNELHATLRDRVRAELMPWCAGCKSHHVAPMLWRYATAKAGARIDAGRRYRLAEPEPDRPPAEAVRRFLSFYGPAKPADFATWSGVTRPHARRLWDEVAGELAEGGRGTWLLASDVGALQSPPQATGLRLIPPGDPYLQKPNRPLLAPGAELRKRLFRPVASPGAVIEDGRLAGLWRARLQRRRLLVTVEPLGPITRAELEDEAQRMAVLRGASEAVIA